MSHVDCSLGQPDVSIATDRSGLSRDSEHPVKTLMFRPDSRSVEVGTPERFHPDRKRQTQWHSAFSQVSRAVMCRSVRSCFGSPPAGQPGL